MKRVFNAARRKCNSLTVCFATLPRAGGFNRPMASNRTMNTLVGAIEMALAGAFIRMISGISTAPRCSSSDSSLALGTRWEATRCVS